MYIYIYWKLWWILNIPNFLFHCNHPFSKRSTGPNKNSAGTAPLGFLLRARFIRCTWVTGCRLHVPPGGSRHQPWSSHEWQPTGENFSTNHWLQFFMRFLDASRIPDIGTHGNFGLLNFMSLSDRSTHGFHACATLCRTSSVNSFLFAFCSVLVPFSLWNKECHQKHYI